MSTDLIVKCLFCNNDIKNTSEEDWSVFINHTEKCPREIAKEKVNQRFAEFVKTNEDNVVVVNFFFPDGTYVPDNVSPDSNLAPSFSSTGTDTNTAGSSTESSSSSITGGNETSTSTSLSSSPAVLYTHHEGSEIVPRIFLTSVILGKDPQWLKAHNITTVINCIDKRESKPLPIELQKQAGISTYICLDMDDSFQGGEKINQGVEGLKKAYDAGENIVIHCAAGRSRSATVLMAYLLQHYTATPPFVSPSNTSPTITPKWSLKDVIVTVKKRRPVVSPNLGFCKYLIGIEKQLYGPSLSIPEDLIDLHKESLTYAHRLKQQNKK